MLKVLLLVALAAVAALSGVPVKEADAAGRGSRGSASGSINQSHQACVDLTAKCFGVCVKNPRDEDFDACMNVCAGANQACKKIADWWTGDERAAAKGVIGSGVKDSSSAAGSKLKASDMSTRSGAATATMSGVVSRAKGIAVNGGSASSTKGAVVLNNGLNSAQRGSLAGHPVGGAASTTFRAQ